MSACGRSSTAATRRSSTSSATLHPDAFRIFEALSNRSLADPDEISQSAMSALFGHVWDTGDLGRNMRGGSGLLPDALGASLGPDRPPRHPRDVR